jgi:hypothetical protein
MFMKISGAFTLGLGLLLVVTSKSAQAGSILPGQNMQITVIETDKLAPKPHPYFPILTDQDGNNIGNPGTFKTENMGSTTFNVEPCYSGITDTYMGGVDTNRDMFFELGPNEFLYSNFGEYGGGGSLSFKVTMTGIPAGSIIKSTCKTPFSFKNGVLTFVTNPNKIPPRVADVFYWK